MSRKAFNNIKNHIEIKFLKSCSYEKINEMMNQLHDKIKKLEDENAKHLEALKAIRFSGNNFDDTAIEMQIWAAWAMEPEKWIKPGTKLK